MSIDHVVDVRLRDRRREALVAVLDALERVREALVPRAPLGGEGGHVRLERADDVGRRHVHLVLLLRGVLVDLEDALDAVRGARPALGRGDRRRRGRRAHRLQPRELRGRVLRAHGPREVRGRVVLARADVVAHLLVEEAEVVVVHERAARRRALDGGRRVLDLLREVLADVARRRLEERVVAPPDGQRPAAAAAHRRRCLRPAGRGVVARVPGAGVWSCRSPGLGGACGRVAADLYDKTTFVLRAIGQEYKKVSSSRTILLPRYQSC